MALIGLVAASTRAPAQDALSRQVTLFGIVATPGSTRIDEKLESIGPQLRKLLPGHGFELLEVQSKRLVPGQSVSCTKLNGFGAETRLLDALDPNGKVQLQFALGQGGQLQMTTVVSTPPNQLFFIDKLQANGSRLIIGIGAR